MNETAGQNLQTLVQERVLEALAVLRRRARVYALLGGALRLAVALVVAGLSQLLIDRWLRLSLDQRAALNVLITLYWLWVCYRWILLPTSQALADETLASLVDAANPQLVGRLSSAVELARRPLPPNTSEQLADAVLQEAAAAAQRVDFLTVLNHRRARLRLTELGLIAAGVGLTWALLPTTMNTWFQRNWLVRDLPWPQSTYINPLGFDRADTRRVPRGDEFELAAEIVGKVPRSAVVAWSSASGKRGRETMRRIGERRLIASLGALSEPLSLRIIGGDETTRTFIVQPVDRPQVVRSLATITPPEYTRVAPLTVEQQTSLELLAGATLTLEVALNKPVSAARFVGGADEQIECEQRAPDRLRVSWMPPASGTYRFELVDRDGFDSRRPVQFSIKVVNDRAPLVKLDAPGVGEIITPIAELPLTLHAKDEYGLARAQLGVARGEEPADPLPLPALTGGSSEYRAEVVLALRSLGFKPAERVALRAEAADHDPRGPNVGRSEALALRVVSVEDFLADVSRRELELRREFERLISVQRGTHEALRQLIDEAQARRLASTALAQRLSALLRRQDGIAGTCSAITRRFELLLTEMRINRVARSGDERRIEDRVIRPLLSLNEGSIPAATESLQALRRSIAEAEADAALLAQERLLREMQAILANMLEWEGYREAVALLQEAIDRQKDVHGATIEALRKQLEDLLEPEDGSREPPREP